MEIAALIESLGPTGAILGLGIAALRALMPLLVAAVGHLGKIAEAVEKAALGIQVLDKKIDILTAEHHDTSEKVAILVDRQARETNRRPARVASGD